MHLDATRRVDEPKSTLGTLLGQPLIRWPVQGRVKCRTPIQNSLLIDRGLRGLRG